MIFDPSSVRKNMLWHIPGSISNIALGIYLLLAVFMIPSFARNYQEMMQRGNTGLLLPYVFFILIGVSVMSFWFYTKLDSDQKIREQYFSDTSIYSAVPIAAIINGYAEIAADSGPTARKSHKKPSRNVPAVVNPRYLMATNDATFPGIYRFKDGSYLLKILSNFKPFPTRTLLTHRF